MIPTATYFEGVDLQPILPPVDSVYFKTQEVRKEIPFFNNQKEY
jgi:hypothetical protein